MKIKFEIEVNVGKREPQATKEFLKSDGKAMITYLKEIIINRVSDSWQYNAIVKNVKIRQSKAAG